MYIESINIKSFGRLTDYSITLSDGMNIFEGDNESGKSTIAEFIKFMLYGMQSKTVGDNVLSERKKYINWNTGLASGSMTVVIDGIRILIERSMTASTDGMGNIAYRETLKMTDTETGAQLHRGKNPGDALLGIPEDVFASTAFIRQLSGARVDGDKLSSSAENLLFTADEAVSTEKSIERLDAVRRQLLHKNGKGGSIYDKERRRAEFSMKLESAKRVAGELIIVENSITELTEKRKTAESNREASRKKNKNYEAVKKLHLFNRLHSVEDELSMLCSERESLITSALVGDHFPDKDYVNELHACGNTLSSASASITRLSRRLDDCRRELGNASDVERRRHLICDENAADEILHTAKKKQKAKRSLHITAALLLMVTVICVGVAAVYRASLLLPLVGAAGVAVTVIGAVACLSAASAASRKLNALLTEYGANSIEELPIILDELAAAAVRDDELSAEIESLDEELRAKYDVYDGELAHAKELISKRGITVQSNDDIPEKLGLLTSASEMISVREDELSKKTEACRNVKAAILSDLDGADEKTVREITKEINVAEYDAITPSALRLEVEFNENAVARLTETIHELEVKRVQLLSMREDPAELAVKLDLLTSEISSERKRYDAIMLAIQTLGRAGEGVRESIVPRIRELAKLYLSGITDGKYTNIAVNGEFAMTVNADGAFRELEYMSEGTADAAYLSLRMALIRILYKKTLPPLVFDETFAHMDDNRAAAAMKLLSSAGNMQSIIFTCHDRESKLASALSERTYNQPYKIKVSIV